MLTVAFSPISGLCGGMIDRVRPDTVRMKKRERFDGRNCF